MQGDAQAKGLVAGKRLVKSIPYGLLIARIDGFQHGINVDLGVCIDPVDRAPACGNGPLAGLEIPFPCAKLRDLFCTFKQELRIHGGFGS
ncbi:MAG: hypothetical protein IPK16_18245 [Anaerolineales bacterium]|nr:hypothetical protein [Anaerolineales bacterium]